MVCLGNGWTENDDDATELQLAPGTACLCAIILVVTPGMASAWWDSGHRLVALVAWSRMDVPTRTRVLRLLGEHPQVEKYFTPLHVAGWPVATPWSSRRPPSGATLSVSPIAIVRPGTTSTGRCSSRRRLAGHCSPGYASTGDAAAKGASLATQDLNVIQAISLCRQRLKARDATEAERAVCVTWLCHLVGDVHQPCHSKASFTARRFLRGDRGGKDVPIRGDKKDINLHMYWDGQFGPTRTLDGDLVRRAAALLADRKLVAAGRRAEKRLRGKPGWPKVTGWPGTWSILSPILAAIGSGESDPEKVIPAVELSRGLCPAGSGGGTATSGRSRIPAGPVLAEVR
ncbi:MAG: hypothetical protein CM1200mP2_59710 [Planctomycetaceae bacterium]|nr:MAG: hypothetical protein CM1200mP2_59710 [Planctomycetaceae bacterium]